MKIVTRKEVIRVEYEENESPHQDQRFLINRGYKKIESGISHGIQFAIWEKEIKSST